MDKIIEKQNYNFDLLKVIATLMVIVLHYLNTSMGGALGNTIPGSFAFYLWCHNKEIMYSQLIDMIIEFAEKEHEEKMKNNYTYNSKIIDVQSIGGCKGGKFGVKG